jgi:predicted Zn-dependent protease
LSLLALDYTKTLPAETLKTWPVPVALADAHIRLGEWQKLESEATTANWGKFDFLRHASLARTFREQHRQIDFDREWNLTLKQANSAEALSFTIDAISDWNWQNEMADLLWALSKHPEKQKEALVTLYQHYAKTSDTQGLYRVLVRLEELDSSNLDVQNNLAQVGLLLNANPEEARRAAAEVYHKAPKNPAYTTTYAYSLLSQGNSKEALRLMKTLNQDELSNPTISAYYGIFLAANGDETARSYLDFGKQANLLPEEKALIDKAYASLDSRSRRR